MSTDDEVNKALATELIGKPVLGGLRKLCTDAKRCGLGNLCEHALPRDQSVELISAWTSRKEGDCENYFPRTELGSLGDVPKNRNRAGQSKHNRHAPPRDKARQGLILPPHLQTPPDLMVKRHIKDGKNIKGDD